MYYSVWVILYSLTATPPSSATLRKINTPFKEFSAASRTTNTTVMHSVAVRVAASSTVTRTALPAITATPANVQGKFKISF